jgi:hypothetical protein
MFSRRWGLAELMVSEAVGEVLVAEAVEKGGTLTDIWNNLWATIDALNALRASLHVKLPPEIIRTLQSFEAMDHRQFPGGRNKQVTKAIQHWRAYHSGLCKGADATEPTTINDGVSSARRRTHECGPGGFLLSTGGATSQVSAAIQNNP